MKKIAKLSIAIMIFALAVMSLTACSGGGSEYEGEWKAVKVTAFEEEMTAEEADMEMTLTLGSDGKASIAHDEENEACSWEEGEDSATITVGEGANATKMTAKVNGDKLTLSIEGLADIEMEKVGGDN